jgi:GNAT superfamily N-acetyltransferase
MLNRRDTRVPTICTLASRPQATHTLARYHYSEWEALYPDDTVASFAEDLSRAPGSTGLPTTWILTAGEQVVGSVSLLDDDLDTDPRLSPWLANLWAHRDWRGRGLGKRLVLHACEQAAIFGFTTLYLYTPEHAAFYAGLGWRQLQSTLKNDVPITIMRYSLAPKATATEATP